MLCLPLLLFAWQSPAHPTDAAPPPQGSTLLADATSVELIQQYRADRDALRRLWSFPWSIAGSERKIRHADAWLSRLDAMNYEALDHRSRID